ncbi:MAG: 30S ribosomal protein S3, partial [Betaproteobacteria bacterium]|nr:30S ribosomal protein S3 [Betaproteobacteria bacterium]
KPRKPPGSRPGAAPGARPARRRPEGAEGAPVEAKADAPKAIVKRVRRAPVAGDKPAE